MVTWKDSPKQPMLGLTLHSLTGTKEAVMNLHRFGYTISYNSVISYGDEWSELAIPANQHLLQSIPVHYSVDDNDGWQEKFPGFGITQDNNTTLFLPLLLGKNIEYLKNIWIFFLLLLFVNVTDSFYIPNFHTLFLLCRWIWCR